MLQRAGARPSVRPDVARRVRLTVHEVWHEEMRRRARLRATGWAAGLAAAAAAAVLLAVFLFPQRRVSPPVAPRLIARVEASGGTTSVRTGDDVAAGSVVSTAPMSFATLQWHDHGSLRIAADSRIHFTSDDSLELERGAIYFASAPSGSPVAIRTRFGVVRDVGTAFEVRVEPAALRVRVREGTVELQQNGARERAEAGTELLAQQSGVTRAAIPTTGPDWNWVLAAAPPIILDGNARGVLMAIAREKGFTLVFSDRLLADRVGRTSLHDHVPLTPDEALAAATVAADLSYHVSGNTLLIERRQLR
ncbi:MAG TPA: FecR family protein [Thermoanaerobaculia bacterium]